MMWCHLIISLAVGVISIKAEPPLVHYSNHGGHNFNRDIIPSTLTNSDTSEERSYPQAYPNIGYREKSQDSPTLSLSGINVDTTPPATLEEIEASYEDSLSKLSGGSGMPNGHYGQMPRHFIQNEEENHGPYHEILEHHYLLGKNGESPRIVSSKVLKSSLSLGKEYSSGFTGSGSGGGGISYQSSDSGIGNEWTYPKQNDRALLGHGHHLKSNFKPSEPFNLDFTATSGFKPSFGPPMKNLNSFVEISKPNYYYGQSILPESGYYSSSQEIQYAPQYKEMSVTYPNQPITFDSPTISSYEDPESKSNNIQIQKPLLASSSNNENIDEYKVIFVKAPGFDAALKSQPPHKKRKIKTESEIGHLKPEEESILYHLFSKTSAGTNKPQVIISPTQPILNSHSQSTRIYYVNGNEPENIPANPGETYSSEQNFNINSYPLDNTKSLNVQQKKQQRRRNKATKLKGLRHSYIIPLKSPNIQRNNGKSSFASSPNNPNSLNHLIPFSSENGFMLTYAPTYSPIASASTSIPTFIDYASHGSEIEELLKAYGIQTNHQIQNDEPNQREKVVRSTLKHPTIITTTTTEEPTHLEKTILLTSKLPSTSSPPSKRIKAKKQSSSLRSTTTTIFPPKTTKTITKSTSSPTKRSIPTYTSIEPTFMTTTERITPKSTTTKTSTKESRKSPNTLSFSITLLPLKKTWEKNATESKSEEEGPEYHVSSNDSFKEQYDTKDKYVSEEKSNLEEIESAEEESESKEKQRESEEVENKSSKDIPKEEGKEIESPEESEEVKEDEIETVNEETNQSPIGIEPIEKSDEETKEVPDGTNESKDSQEDVKSKENKTGEGISETRTNKPLDLDYSKSTKDLEKIKNPMQPIRKEIILKEDNEETNIPLFFESIKMTTSNRSSSENLSEQQQKESLLFYDKNLSNNEEIRETIKINKSKRKSKSEMSGIKGGNLRGSKFRIKPSLAKRLQSEGQKNIRKVKKSQKNRKKKEHT